MGLKNYIFLFVWVFKKKFGVLWDLFWDSLGFVFLEFLNFLIIWSFGIFLIFFGGFCGFFYKLVRLLLKVTEITTEHQKWPKVSQNRIKSSFFCQRAKNTSAGGQSPLQELEVKPA